MAITNKVYIWGPIQSNGIGRVEMVNLPTASEGYKYNVKIWQPSGEFHAINPNERNNNQWSDSNNAYHFEVFMYQLANYLEEDIYLVKIGNGGTQMTGTGASSWNIAGTPWYNNTLTELTAVSNWFANRKKFFEFKCHFVRQGESDIDKDNITNMITNPSDWVTDFRDFQTNVEAHINSIVASNAYISSYSPKWVIAPTSLLINRPAQWDASEITDMYNRQKTEAQAFAKHEFIDTALVSNFDGVHDDAASVLSLWNNQYFPLLKTI